MERGVICLDTHVLVWRALAPNRLSAEALRCCEKMEKEGGCASAISIWEIGLKIRRGDLDLGMPLSKFVRMLEGTGSFRLVPVSADIWMENLALDWSHRDPADRTIVVTARHLGVPLLTKDETIRAWAGANAIW